METNQIQMLTPTFEGHAQKTENEVEYWLARDLQYLLGYAKWDNFLNVIASVSSNSGNARSGRGSAWSSLCISNRAALLRRAIPRSGMAQSPGCPQRT